MAGTTNGAEARASTAWIMLLTIASTLATLAARAAVRRHGGGDMARLAIAYLAATLVYKGVLVLASLGLGGVAVALSPTYAAQQFVRNGVFLLGLAAVYRALVAVGMPAPARAADHGVAA